MFMQSCVLLQYLGAKHKFLNVAYGSTHQSVNPQIDTFFLITYKHLQNVRLYSRQKVGRDDDYFLEFSPITFCFII